MENYSSSVAIFAPMEICSYKKEIYQKLYKELFKGLSAYAYSFLKDSEEAYNITNDSFLSLWENRDKVNWEESLTPWLFSVTRNKCLNVLKKRVHSDNYRTFSVKDKTNYLNYLAVQSDAPVKVYEQEVNLLLSKAMEKMTPKVRTTFVLSRIKGMKYSEIAETHNISNRTIEARIKLAMLILRKTFKDYL